jgi:hypothetical protein
MNITLEDYQLSPSLGLAHLENLLLSLFYRIEPKVKTEAPTIHKVG